MTRTELLEIIVREFELKPIMSVTGLEQLSGYWIIPTDAVSAVKGFIRMLFVDRVAPEATNGTLYLLDAQQAIVFCTVDDNNDPQWILSNIHI